MNTETSPSPSEPSTAQGATLDPNAPDANAAGAGAKAEAGTPEAQIEALKADVNRFRDLALRNQADLENFRKRSLRDKDDAVRYANVSLLEKLIPVIDNFELGLTAAKGSTEGGAILAGMDMVFRQLNDFLTQNGVETLQSEGQKFDPNLHEAFAQEESNSVPEGFVVRQLRKGFKLRDRLLRPAAVVVSKGPKA